MVFSFHKEAEVTFVLFNRYMINDRLMVLISYRSGIGVIMITFIDGRCCRSLLPNPHSWFPVNRSWKQQSTNGCTYVLRYTFS